MEQCHILREYAQYVAKVRKYTKEMNLDGAVELAVDECIQEGILVEFLRKNKSEVVAMSIFEYNQEEEERKWKESVYEAARAEGRAEEIIAAGYEFGLSEKTILERLQKKLAITPQKAREYLATYTKETVQRC